MAIIHGFELSKKMLPELARIFRALSSPIRLKILFYLSDGEHCACEFPPLVGASQPNTSRNLDILKKAGLVKYRRDGQKLIYALNEPSLVPWIHKLYQAIHGTESK